MGVILINGWRIEGYNRTTKGEICSFLQETGVADY
jgi:hypothetical protein